MPARAVERCETDSGVIRFIGTKESVPSYDDGTPLLVGHKLKWWDARYPDMPMLLGTLIKIQRHGAPGADQELDFFVEVDEWRFHPDLPDQASKTFMLFCSRLFDPGPPRSYQGQLTRVV